MERAVVELGKELVWLRGGIRLGERRLQQNQVWDGILQRRGGSTWRY